MYNDLPERSDSQQSHRRLGFDNKAPDPVARHYPEPCSVLVTVTCRHSIDRNPSNEVPTSVRSSLRLIVNTTKVLRRTRRRTGGFHARLPRSPQLMQSR